MSNVDRRSLQNAWCSFACWCAIVVAGAGLATAQIPTPDDATSNRQAAAIDQALLHAETYYWFGMAEQGNMAAYRKGLEHLRRARRLVDDAPLSDEEPLSDEDTAQYEDRIAALQIDLDEQAEIGHDTLYGIFPLTRFITRSLFAESTILDTFEVIDDPTVMASTFAAKKLALTTITEWRQRHQLDVAFTSVPHNPQLENEALYVFNTHPKFFVHNLREVTDALDAAELAEFRAGNITPKVKRQLLDAFGINDLLIVLVRENDAVDDDYFYVLEGEIYQRAGDTPTRNFAVMGFSRDRNRWFTPIVFVNIALLASAFLAYWLQARLRRRAAVGARMRAFILLPLVAFVVGRVTPWFAGPLIRSISPVPETLAIVSFWVPALAGVALTVVPMTGLWLVAKRLSKIWPVFTLEARVASVFMGISAGLSAFLSVAMFLFLQGDAWFVLIPATVALFALATLFGRALDSVDEIPSAFAVLPCLLAMPLGAAIFLISPLSLWCIAGLTIASCFAPLAISARSASASTSASGGESTARQPDLVPPDARRAVSISQLGELAERPCYQKFASYGRSWALVEPLLDGSTVHLGLHSDRGCGLSETARTISSELAARIREHGGDVVEMYGECPQAEGEPKPYAAFQTALAQHFEIELLGPGRGNSEELDAALGEVFQSVVPFAGVFFPGSATSQASSGEDIAASIAWTLERIARRKPIVLLIDDAQWIDEPSRGLLKHLIRRFPSGGKVPLAILIASHEAAVLDDLELEASQRSHLEIPTVTEQVQILTGGIGLSAKSAREIVDHVGGSAIEQGGLFWLLQVVSSLARSGALVSSDEGVMLEGDKWPEHEAIPGEMREVLADQLRKHPQYRTIIQCAACACNGREFRSSLVAQALDRPKLDLLIDLDRIDQETSILYDVTDRDDVFAFQSSFMLDVVRQELQIDRNHRSRNLPQIIREHHARLGALLETAGEAHSQNLYQLASHFCAAGSQHADRGLKYSLQAVEAACAILDFSTASYYLEAAEDCAKLLGKPDAVEPERLYVQCLQAHVTGQFEDHRQAAEAGASFLARSPEYPTRLLLAIAQVHYDAGKSSGQAHWFDRSLEIGLQLVDESRSPQDQALGRHFIGISLPPDQAEERKTQFREALEIMQAVPEDRTSLELLGKIWGTLATELSRGSVADQQEAKELLERRLELIDRHKVGDLRGQAMTHGGLGRLAFSREPPDLATAKFHFAKDLELSNAINDQQGLIQMHSLLGACELQEGNSQAALDHYRKSWELAQTVLSRFFAGAGLLECFAQEMLRERYREMTRELLQLARAEGVPQACAQELQRALQACPPDWADSDNKELQQFAQS